MDIIQQLKQQMAESNRPKEYLSEGFILLEKATQDKLVEACGDEGNAGGILVYLNSLLMTPLVDAGYINGAHVILTKQTLARPVANISLYWGGKCRYWAEIPYKISGNLRLSLVQGTGKYDGFFIISQA